MDGHFPEYHPVINRFWKLIYETSAFIAPYDPLPEDPTPVGIPFRVMGVSFPLDYFSAATVDQVRRYLVLCTRGERFCDGHIGAEIDSGAFLAALRRLRELRASMS